MSTLGQLSFPMDLHWATAENDREMLQILESAMADIEALDPEENEDQFSKECGYYHEALEIAAPRLFELVQEVLDRREEDA